MQQLPPIVIECPTCGERYLVSHEANQPSEKATLFSDGYFVDEQVWRTPGIIGCVTCELGFIPQNGKIIATPSWDEFYKNWSHLKQAQPPAAGALVLELRARKEMDAETEKILRKELWYSVNHTEAGKALFNNNKKFAAFWQNSLERYEELLDSNTEAECILKAEINRQLGRLEQCLSLLEPHTGSLSNCIKHEATKGNKQIAIV